MPKKTMALHIPFGRAWRRAVFLAVPVFVAAFLAPLPSLAQTPGAIQNTQLTAEAAGVTGGTTDLVVIIGRIINIALGFIGIVFLVLMLYAGYMYMTAAGDPEKVKKAVNTIKNSVIGLVIIASAWAITSFILGFFADMSGGGISGGTTGPASQFTVSPGASCLGRGIIDMQLPDRNAVDVPRNSPIIVTFKEPIKPESMMSDWTSAASTSKSEWALNDKLIKIYKTAQGADTALSGDKVKVRYTKDLKTFVFKPVDYLGSQTAPMGYTVILMGGNSGILKNDGSPAITCSSNNQYAWQFEVSTALDLTPPFVTAVIPPAGGLYARNIVVQINFNKAMDPTAAQGKTSDGFSNIETMATPNGGGQPAAVSGEYRVSNQYRTVEFVTDSKCGTNSCNRDIYCLPGLSGIDVTAKAATLDGPGPQAIYTNNGYDGLVSVVGNSLDGNQMGGDGKAEGPPADDFSWSFGTTNDIKLTPPAISFTIPDADPNTGKGSNVPLDQPVWAVFDSFLQSSTLTSDNVTMDAHGFTEQPDSFWWAVGMKLVKQDGTEADYKAVPPEIPSAAAVIVNHRAYMPSGTYPKLNYYDPYISSEVQDAYQNCFNPARKCGAGSGFNCCKYTPTAAECKTLLHP
ncbi:hypothetical protein HZC53_03975 [Candidatus Uhrbacteria bacterium]|nr:hypothetical protein [Candidatus Uhrbacteria bacterium]